MHEEASVGNLLVSPRSCSSFYATHISTILKSLIFSPFSPIYFRFIRYVSNLLIICSCASNFLILLQHLIHYYSLHQVDQLILRSEIKKLVHRNWQFDIYVVQFLWLSMPEIYNFDNFKLIRPFCVDIDV